MSTIALLIIFLPLLGFVLAGSFGQKLGDWFSQIVTCGLMGVSMCLALYLFLQMGLKEETLLIPLFTWIHVELFDVSWGLQIDSLSLVMMAVVTLVSSMVHIYSIGYMKGDPGVPRFMGYLSLFTFFMLALVVAPNFLFWLGGCGAVLLSFNWLLV